MLYIEKSDYLLECTLEFKVINKDRTEFVECSLDKLTFSIEKVSEVSKHDVADPNHDSGVKNEQLLIRKLVALDVGCRWGLGHKLVTADRLFQVYGFDPDPQECQRLSQYYDDVSISFFSVALAQTAGPRTLFITQEPACSSLFQPDPSLTEHYPALACARQISTIQIQTTTLDMWAAQNMVQIIDYIKVDTQGSELEILMGGADALQTVRCLEVEVEFNPIYLGQPVFADVDSFLRSQGFVLWKLSNQVHYSHQGEPNVPLGEDQIFYDDMQAVKHTVYGGQMYWANAHYVKKDVLSREPRSTMEATLDIALFDALGMPDVVDHLRH